MTVHDGPNDLLELARSLVAIPSESFQEQAIVQHIETLLSGLNHLSVARIGDNLVARTDLGRTGRVVLAGHTDTVPGKPDQETRIEGDTLWGLGAADMKGGLAVMLALAERHTAPPVDLTFAFYAREEVAAIHNGLIEVAATSPDLLSGDVAILGEPTGGDVEAGCQGVLRAEVTLTGARAHTARAWMGRNAIHRLQPLLEALNGYEPRRPVIGGCEFHEAFLAVIVEGGIATNVVPDSVKIQLSHRFAPDRSIEDAEAFLQSELGELLEDGDSVEVVDRSAAAWPATEHPFVSEMIRRRDLPVRAKLGWTDVARFSELGVPAVNLGPGDATLAHTAEERVERRTIERSFDALSEAIDHGF
jgi:succinyl-diaminopimelate desuccinylase